MTGNEARRKFLDYFKQNEHQVVRSSSLVPHEDPTLLFINAGMVQFKRVFLGEERRDYVRATTSQKCVRAGGKHNDFNVDTEEWDKEWSFLIQPENERQWKLSDYLLANSDNCYCDWEAGPWLNKETLPMFKIIRDAIKDYANDDKKKFNALMDFILLAFSGTEVDAFDSAEEFEGYVSNITFIILQLLNCNNYVKANVDWSTADLDVMVVKSEEETDDRE